MFRPGASPGRMDHHEVIKERAYDGRAPAASQAPTLPLEVRLLGVPTGREGMR